jgi:hypothetical protein
MSGRLRQAPGWIRRRGSACAPLLVEKALELSGLEPPRHARVELRIILGTKRHQTPPRQIGQASLSLGAMVILQLPETDLPHVVNVALPSHIFNVTSSIALEGDGQSIAPPRAPPLG